MIANRLKPCSDSTAIASFRRPSLTPTCVARAGQYDAQSYPLSRSRRVDGFGRRHHHLHGGRDEHARLAAWFINLRIGLTGRSTNVTARDSIPPVSAKPPEREFLAIMAHRRFHFKLNPYVSQTGYYVVEELRAVQK